MIQFNSFNDTGKRSYQISQEDFNGEKMARAVQQDASVSKPREVAHFRGIDGFLESSEVLHTKENFLNLNSSLTARPLVRAEANSNSSSLTAP